jgi:5-methylcytosine-specific restriction endonuclease McrA
MKTTKISYSEKLRDPRWQKKRLQVLERAGWICQVCGTGEQELQVHHPRYVNCREPWQYDNLISLCASCHSRHHVRSKPYVDPFLAIVTHDAKHGNRDASAVLAILKTKRGIS